MNIQKRIRELMEERGWSDYKLAKESGLSNSTISNMFNRNNSPTVPTLEQLCGAFGITLAQFFSENDSDVDIKAEQKELFAKWSTLTPAQKDALLKLIDTIN